MAQPLACGHPPQADHAQLRDALTYAEAIVDTVREPLLVLDRDLRIRSANRSFYRTFHVGKEETENRLLYELGNGHWNFPQLRLLLEELIPNKATIEDFEVQHDFPDLGSKVMLFNARRLRREGSHTELTLLAIEDITDRKRVDQALRDSEERWRGLFERMAEGFFLAEIIYNSAGEAHDFRFLQVNPAFQTLTGVHDAAGQTVREAIPGIQDQLIEAYGRVVRTGKPESFELFVPVLQNRWFDVRARPMERGRFAVLFLDITERKNAELQLRESERRQAALVALGDQVRDLKDVSALTRAAMTIAGTILGASRAGYGTVDSTQEYVTIENDWTDSVPTLAGTYRFKDFGQELADGLRRGELIAIADVTTHPITTNESDRWKAFNIRSVINLPLVENGRLVALLFIHNSLPRTWTAADLTFVRKIADRTWAAAERARALIEGQRAQQEREQLTSELRRSNEELSQFAHVVAHDLQSPIRGVTSFAQLLQRRAQGRLASGDREFLTHIIESAHRMQNLVQALLRFAQVGQGQIEETEIAMDLIVDTAMKSLQLQINEQGARITRGSLPAVRGDSVQLVQLLQNLIGNALKYRRPGNPPEISISATKERAHRLFAISDNGEGIAPEHFTKVFEPFKRLHGADVPGTGLGLAVCQKIVNRHGGRIWVESQPGVGSTFYFTLLSA